MRARVIIAVPATRKAVAIQGALIGFGDVRNKMPNSKKNGPKLTHAGTNGASISIILVVFILEKKNG